LQTRREVRGFPDNAFAASIAASRAFVDDHRPRGDAYPASQSNPVGQIEAAKGVSEFDGGAGVPASGGTPSRSAIAVSPTVSVTPKRANSGSSLVRRVSGLSPRSNPAAAHFVLILDVVMDE
jgi:hypothetical protein